MKGEKWKATHVKINNWLFNIDEELSSTDMVHVLRNTKFDFILHHYNRPCLVSSAGQQMQKPVKTKTEF